MSNKEELTYEWLPNLTQYEARIMLGLTAQEAMACVIGALAPVSIIPSFFGLIIALLTVVIILLSIKKIDRFGGKPFLIYLMMRIFERVQRKQIEIPIIMGGASSRIELENWQGETIMTLDDLGG